MCAYTELTCSDTNITQYINFVDTNTKKNDFVNNFLELKHELHIIIHLKNNHRKYTYTKTQKMNNKISNKANPFFVDWFQLRFQEFYIWLQ